MVPVREPKTYSILLAVDLAMVREGLAVLCQSQPRYRVVAQCGEGGAALRFIQSQKPDIAILDLNLLGLFTLEVVRNLQAAQVSTRIVVLSTRSDRKTVVDALRAGVKAFLLKSGPANHLFEAFEQILGGGIFIPPNLELGKIISADQSPAVEDPMDALSVREYQVFALLVDGNRPGQIAGRLGISPKTVDTYRASLMRKLDICNVAGLVRFAIQRDLISVR
jgi:two-component system invasion response regulator UvrY